MGKGVVGTIIEKAYYPPPGAPDKYWCYIMVETKYGDRLNIRLHKKVHNRITVGDKVQFEKPWRKNKPVKDIQIVRG